MKDLSRVPNLKLVTAAAEAMEDALCYRRMIGRGISHDRDGVPTALMLSALEMVIADIKAEVDRRAAREEAIL